MIDYMKIKIIILITLIGVAILWILFERYGFLPIQNIVKKTVDTAHEVSEEVGNPAHPLSIEALRNGEYTGSEIVIHEELEPGSNYRRYIASYQSEGNTIYALFTIPNSLAGSEQVKPESGWPVIVFNHGYIPPAEYRTNERYVAYQDAFARNGYITLKSDYRGHGNSQGEASGGYGSNGYTIDVLNALASVKRHPDADPERIGFWGHSMGGHITLRSMVVRDDIKAGVIWAGVVASYPDLINNWRRNSPNPSRESMRRVSGWRSLLVEQYGEPNDQDPFWRTLSANTYLSEISGPVQIHHGTADTSVPVEFSQKLDQQLKEAGKTVEYYEYSGDDHDITANFNTAIQRSVEFFDRYVKNN